MTTREKIIGLIHRAFFGTPGAQGQPLTRIGELSVTIILAAILTAFADAKTTLVGIEQAGRIEINSIVDFVHGLLGVYGGTLAIKLTVLALVVGYCMRQGDEGRLQRWTALFVLGQVAAVVWNLGRIHP